MKTKYEIAQKKIINNIGQFFAQPEIAGIFQLNPILAGISTYFSGQYSQEHYENLKTYLHLVSFRLQTVEQRYLTIDFFDNYDGKRIIGKIFKSIYKDGRNEKIEAMSNLTVNIALKSRFNLDEKEMYVDILDILNVIQLSVLQRAVIDMRNREGNKHRGLGWEIIFKEYGEKGVSKPLFMQSLRVLESNGLINENTAVLSEADKTHFITDFGEQFYDFISNPLTKNSGYLLQ